MKAIQLRPSRFN